MRLHQTSPYFEKPNQAIFVMAAALLLLTTSSYGGEANPCSIAPVSQQSAFEQTGSHASANESRGSIPQRGINTYTVNSTSDTTDGVCDQANCTLREALLLTQDEAANIQFATPLFSVPQTINLLTALPTLTNSVRLRGPGAQLLTVQRALTGTGEFRVFTIAQTVGVVMCGLTISQGFTQLDGGGIYSEGFLFLYDVQLTNNTARRGGGVALIGVSGNFSGSTFSNNVGFDRGGAIYVEPFSSSFNLVNSTLSGNRANSAGGGIAVGGNSTGNSVLIRHCTIANNSVDSNFGAGIFDGTTSTRPTRLRNNILANNTPVNLSTNGIANTISEGFNLSTDNDGVVLIAATDKVFANAALAPLANNGGTTRTHALLAGSVAIDAGTSASNLTDQRGAGFVRPVDLPVANAIGGDGGDIGAFEVQSDLFFRNGFE